MTIKIRPVKPTDRVAMLALARLVDIHDIFPTLSQQGRSMLAKNRSREIDRIFEQDRFQSLKAVRSEELLGYIAWRDGYYISHLYIHPNHQRQGIGTRLLGALRQQKTSSVLQLRSSVNAVGFYRRCGFEASGPEQQIKGIRFVPMTLQL